MNNSDIMYICMRICERVLDARLTNEDEANLTQILANNGKCAIKCKYLAPPRFNACIELRKLSHKQSASYVT